MLLTILKYKRAILIIVLVILTTLGFLGYLIYTPMSVDNIEGLIKPKLNFAKEEKDYIYQKLNVNANEKYEFIGLNSNYFKPNNPTYTLVHSPFISQDNTYKSVQVYVFKPERNNIFSIKFSISESAYRGLISGKTFDEVKEIVRSKDLSFDKIDGLVINPPLTPSQIQAAQENIRIQDENDKKYQPCLDSISRIRSKTATNQEIVTYLEQYFKIYTVAELTKLKNREIETIELCGLKNYPDEAQYIIDTLPRLQETLDNAKKNL
jgi:hypothetical protein